jgi:multiple sugar transport system substrate-binding protein
MIGKRRVKVTMCIILAVVMLVPFLSACNKNSDKQQQVSQNTEDQKGDEQKKTDITLWTAWSEESGMGDMIKEFTKKYPDINVKHVKFTNTDDGNVKLDTSLMSGEEVNVFINFGVKRLVPRAEKGILEPLNNYMENGSYNIEEENGDPGYKPGGKYYALPVGATSTFVYINEKYLKDAGLSAPTEDWTIDDYIEYAKKMTKGEGNEKIYGCDSGHHMASSWDTLATSVIGSNRYFKEDGTSNFDNLAFEKSLGFYYDILYKDKIAFPYTEYKATKMMMQDSFMNGRVSMAIGANAIIRYIANAEEYPEGFKAVFAPVPNVTKDQEKNYVRGVGFFDFLSMNAKRPQDEKDASWTLMKWMATEGNIWLTKVGHIPTWKKIDKNEVVEWMLGEKKQYIDIESFKKYVLNYDAPSYLDTKFDAYGQIYTIAGEEADKCLVGEQTVEQAIKNMKERSDAEIKKIK